MTSQSRRTVAHRWPVSAARVAVISDREYYAELWGNPHPRARSYRLATLRRRAGVVALAAAITLLIQLGVGRAPSDGPQPRLDLSPASASAPNASQLQRASPSMVQQTGTP